MKRNIRLLTLISTLVFFLQITSSKTGIVLGNLYYIFYLFTFLILFFISNKKGTNVIYLLLLLICGLSLIFNEIPKFFKSELRLITFVIMLSLTSPFVNSKILIYYRKDLFSKILISNSLIVSISCLLFVLGFKGMVTGRGGFTGLYSHSMLMGPFAAISLIYSLSQFTVQNNKVKKINLVLIGILSFIACVLAASRGALLAMILAVIFLFIRMFNTSIKKLLTNLSKLFLLVLFTYPAWNIYTKRLEEKYVYGKENASITFTRKYLWQNRIEEFMDSPIVGYGFSSVNVLTSKFDKATGIIEPGSSWLAILSMTGILGYVIFLILYLRNLNFLWKLSSNNSHYSFLLGILIFFGVHLFFEGYIFSAGAGLCLIFWLLLGVINLNSEWANKFNREINY